MVWCNYRVSCRSAASSQTHFVTINTKFHIMSDLVQSGPAVCRCGRCLVSVFRLRESLSYTLHFSLECRLNKINCGAREQTKRRPCSQNKSVCIWFGWSPVNSTAPISCSWSPSSDWLPCCVSLGAFITWSKTEQQHARAFIWHERRACTDSE